MLTFFKFNLGFFVFMVVNKNCPMYLKDEQRVQEMHILEVLHVPAHLSCTRRVQTM